MRLLKEPKLEAPELVGAEWATDPALLGALRGRVVLLDFFSYGDPTGMRSLRWVRTLGDHYREAGLTVIGVHVPAYGFERPVEAARREIWRLGIPYPVALDHGLQVFRAYENRDLPARFLVDARGTVRGWHHGADGHAEVEHAARTLLREARPARKLPPPLDPLPGLSRAGRPSWRSTAEIRFGARGLGFGDEPAADTPPPAAGDERELGPAPELRAEGRPYLEGRWRLENDAIVSCGPGSCSVVFEGASVDAVLSPGADAEDAPDGTPLLELSLDGAPIPEPWRGADVEGDDERSEIRVDRGCVYELIDGMPFGIHHLDVRVAGPGVALHLLSFGTVPVPEEE